MSANGILNLYKPGGITSHDAVSKCRGLFSTRRVGHAGTLDPMATGVLPVLIGSSCSAQEELMNHDKTYIAGVRFGITTGTGDITGSTVSSVGEIPCEKDIYAAAASFVGEYDQIPPMYSALKIDGKKLCDLAREGITVERKPRRISVYSAKILRRESESDFLIEFSVSKGTYIRVLAEDIGAKLGCGACLYSLERTRCGNFDVSDAVPLDRLKEALAESGGDKEALLRFLVSPEKVFSHLAAVKLTEFYTRLCKNGNEIYLSRAKIPEETFFADDRCRLYDFESSFFALGRLGDFPDGKAVKAFARFDTK